MKIILTGNHSPQTQQDIVIMQQGTKPKSEEESQSGEEILFVLKEENTNEQSNVITLDSTCMNQDGQYVWISSDQQQNVPSTTVYSIKQLNFSEVN